MAENNNGRNIGIAVGCVAVACACAYCGLVYFQGQKFTEYTSDLTQALGPQADAFTVEITKSGFFSKEFLLKEKQPNPDFGSLSIKGKVDFGFNPTSVMKITAAGNPIVEEFLNKAEPTISSKFNYRFIPEDITLTGKEAQVSNKGDTVRLGALKGKFIPSFVDSSKGYQLDKLDWNLGAALFSLATDDGNLTIQNPEFKMNILAGQNKNASFAFNISGADFASQSYQFSLGAANLSGSSTLDKDKTAEALKLSFANLTVGAGIIKTTIDNWNTAFKVYFPANPIFFDYAAQKLLGIEYCQKIPNLCAPEPVSEKVFEKALQESVSKGQTAFEIEPSEIVMGKESLKMSGLLKKEEKGNGLGEINIALQTAKGGISGLLLMAIPPNAYQNQGKGLYTTTLKPRLNDDENGITLYANGIPLRF